MSKMDKGARLWLLKTCKQNYWRVAHWYEFEDLLQDGFLIWERVVNKYERAPDRVRKRPHMMALFKRAFANHIHDLSKHKSNAVPESKILDLMLRSDGEHLAWNDFEIEGDLYDYERMIAEAPPVLRPLLQKLVVDGKCERLRIPYRVRRKGARQTLNERLCRMINADPDTIDLTTALRSYLTA